MQSLNLIQHLRKKKRVEIEVKIRGDKKRVCSCVYNQDYFREDYSICISSAYHIACSLLTINLKIVAIKYNDDESTPIVYGFWVIV